MLAEGACAVLWLNSWQTGGVTRWTRNKGNKLKLLPTSHEQKPSCRWSAFLYHRSASLLPAAVKRHVKKWGSLPSTVLLKRWTISITIHKLIAKLMLHIYTDWLWAARINDNLWVAASFYFKTVHHWSDSVARVQCSRDRVLFSCGFQNKELGPFVALFLTTPIRRYEEEVLSLHVLYC